MVNKITGPTTKAAAVRSVGRHMQKKEGKKRGTLQPTPALDRAREGVEVVTPSHNLPECLDLKPKLLSSRSSVKISSHAE